MVSFGVHATKRTITILIALAVGLIIALGLFVAQTASAADNGSISGTVTSSTTSSPISGASVTIFSGYVELQTTTDSSGNYTFLNLPDGLYQLSVDHGDYKSSPMQYLDLLNGQQITLDVTLDPIINMSFSSSSYGVIENSGSVNVTVQLTNAATQTVTVDYATSDGTATTADSDYTAASGTLSFAAGETSKTITVDISDDTAIESNETFNVSLSNASNATLVAPTQATVTITDDDDETVDPTQINAALSAATYSVDESAGNVAVSVSLTSPSTQTVTVDYATSDVTAIADSDYVPASGTLSFAAGEMEKTVSVNIMNDMLIEGDETFNISLSNAVNATLVDPTQAPVTITDDDTAPIINMSFSSSSYGVIENSGSVNVTVQLTNAATQTVTVDYATSDGTATTADSDYTAANGTLTFAAGETSKSFTVSILDDTTIESNETFNVSLSNASNATLVAPTQATVTITDDDDETVDPTQINAALSAATYSVDESAGSVAVSVSLTNPSTQTVTVDYATSDVTAIADSDYVPASGTLSFAAGEMEKTVSVNITNDELNEGNETFTIDLSNAVNATLVDPTQAVVTITDNDAAPPPSVSFSAATYNVIESAGSVDVQVTLAEASTEVVSVTYEMSDARGGATDGEDYTAGSGTLTFAAGETSQNLTIAILDDQLVEGNEAFYVSLTNATNATLGDISWTDVTIGDDEQGGSISGSLTAPPTPTGWRRAYFYDANWWYIGSSPINDDGSYGITMLDSGTYHVMFYGYCNNNFYTRYYKDGWDFDNVTSVTVEAGTATTLDSFDFCATPPPQVDLYTYKYTSWWNGKARAGQDFDFHIYSGNNKWLSTANNVVITDTLPAEMSFVSQTNSWGVEPTIDGKTITWSIPEMTPRWGSIRLTTNIADDTVGTEVTNKANITSNTQDTNLGNNTSEKALTIKGEPGTIEGTVQAPNGTKLAYVGVIAYDANGWWVSSDSTDADGSYRIEDIDSGNYTVQFQDWGGRWLGRTTYPDEYYQNAINRDAATSVVVEAGQTTTVDATLDEPAPPLAEFELDDPYAWVSVQTDPRTGKLEIGTSSWMENTTDIAITRAVTCANDVTPSKVELQFVYDNGSEPFLTTMESTGSDNTYRGVLPASVTNKEGTINVIATCGENTESTEIGTVTKIDPSGNITDALTGEPIVGARAELYKLEDWTPKTSFADESPNTCHIPETKGELDWMLLPPAPEMGSPADPLDGEIDPARNPLLTNEIGRYAWDVVPDKCWYVVVQHPGYKTRVSPAVGVVEEPITDLDMELIPMLVIFEKPQGNVTESQTQDVTYSIDVLLTTEMDTEVKVGYAVTGGTATEGSDYTVSAGTLTFAPGELRKTIDIVVKPDTAKEGVETVILSLQKPTGIDIRDGYDTFTLNIQDNIGMPDVHLGAEAYNVDEGVGSVAITATLTAAYTDTVTVAYASIDGTAKAGSDYTTISDTLTFAAGEITKTFTVDILDDATDESDETFTVKLSDASNAALVEPKQATVTIADNDEPIVPGQALVKLSMPTYSIDEDAEQVTIEATLAATSTQVVTVTYATSDSTATAGSDYTAASGTLTFAAGEESKTFTVDITDDTEDEEDETFTVSLSDAINATLSEPKQATVTIVDNDTSSVITAAGGSITTTNGIVVTFPPDAVDDDIIVEVTEVQTTTNALPSKRIGLYYFTITAKKASDGTPVTKFDQPISIKVPYTDNDVAKIQTEDAMTIAYWNGSAWEEIDTTVDTDGKTATAEVDHLTEFVLMAEESGEPASDTPTVYLPLISR